MDCPLSNSGVILSASANFFIVYAGRIFSMTMLVLLEREGKRGIFEINLFFVVISGGWRLQDPPKQIFLIHC